MSGKVTASSAFADDNCNCVLYLHTIKQFYDTMLRLSLTHMVCRIVDFLLLNDPSSCYETPV